MESPDILRKIPVQLVESAAVRQSLSVIVQWKIALLEDCNREAERTKKSIFFRFFGSAELTLQRIWVLNPEELDADCIICVADNVPWR